MKYVLAIVISFFVFTAYKPTYSQSFPNATECGTIIQGEFTGQDQIFEYTLELVPSDQLQVTPSRNSQYLDYRTSIIDPIQRRITRVWVSSSSPTMDTGPLPGRGTYTIKVENQQYGTGIYVISIGCVLADGTVIAPGETVPEDVVQPGNTLPIGAELPSFSGTGFPGLAPVDFASVANIPLLVDIPMTGAVTPSGGEILGYTFDASPEDILDLSFQRLSGNLNLGIVLLSMDNKVVFQASLVTSSTLNTRLELPIVGQYTIGVFRIDLLPPSQAEATAFQITATLNP
jgi:hypothetical protein